MIILAIESSCDDTGAALIEDGKRILSNCLSSQDEVHKRYGGVVPELASRRHLENIVPVLRGALDEAIHHWTR
jgi:N6-L-threonylcarbamoyladenine synthase